MPRQQRSLPSVVTGVGCGRYGAKRGRSRETKEGERPENCLPMGEGSGCCWTRSSTLDECENGYKENHTKRGKRTRLAAEETRWMSVEPEAVLSVVTAAVLMVVLMVVGATKE